MQQKQIFLLFWRTAKNYPVRTSFAIISAVIGTAIGSFAGPLVIAQLLTNIQSGLISFEANTHLLVLYAGVQIYTQVISMRLTVYFLWTLNAHSQRDLYKNIFTKLSAHSMSFHADRFGGALVSQTTKLVGSYDRFLDLVIFNIIPTVVTIIGTAVILSFIFWQYAVVLFGAAIIFTALVIYGSKFLAKRNKEEAQANTAVNAHVADAMTNILTVKSHGKELTELQAFEEKTTYAREKSFNNLRGFLGVTTAYSSITALLNIIAIVAAIYAAANSNLSIGLIYLCLTYTLTVTQFLWGISGTMRGVYRIIGDAHDMTEILLIEPTVIDRSTKNLTVKGGALSIQNLSFTHSDDSHPLFTNLNLNVKPGERIGLVGPSGSGKTTLTKLILRFSDIESGEITIDNQNIANVTQESLRAHIAYVPQEPMLFHRSVADNIAYGKDDATQKDIINAARQANALEFINKLPGGFDTLVGERGVKLSGGQRQRIAIARAILKDAPILILDEATSALDSESEKLIQDALSKLMKGRTSIVIAHRLSTIAKLDRVIVLDGGKVIEEGSHTDLLKKNGKYAKLWSHQSGGFIEE